MRGTKESSPTIAALLQLRLRNHVPQFIDLIDDRHAIRDVKLDNLLFAQAVQLHDDSPKAVAVRGDQHVLAGLRLGENAVVEIGQRSGGRVLQALAVRRRNVVTAAPELNL